MAKYSISTLLDLDAMTNIRAVLASNMKARRKELHISQADLAERIGASPNYISKIEAEKQFPSVQMLEHIALALSCDTVDLFSTKNKRQLHLASVQDALIQNITQQIQHSFAQLIP